MTAKKNKTNRNSAAAGVLTAITAVQGLDFTIKVCVAGNPQGVIDRRHRTKVFSASRPQWDGSSAFTYMVNGKVKTIVDVYSVKTRERKVDGKSIFETDIVTSENLEEAKAGAADFKAYKAAKAAATAGTVNAAA